MTELNVRIASTREAPTAGDSAHTTYGKERNSETSVVMGLFLARARSIVVALAYGSVLP
jgi:hypothetical protein